MRAISDALGLTDTQAKNVSRLLNDGVSLTDSISSSLGSGELGLDGNVLPTVDTTGWAHTGVTLTPYNGPTTISTPNIVLDSFSFNQGITITAPNFTLKRSLISAAFSGQDGDNALTISGGAYGLVEDVEIVCPQVIGQQFDRCIDLTTRTSNSAQNVTFRRVLNHNGQRNYDITGSSGFTQRVTFDSCYVGPNYHPGTGERTHASAVRAAGGTAVTATNTVFRVGAGSFSSGLLATYPENGANGPWTVSGGIWWVEADNDGAYGISCGNTPPEPTNHDYSFHNIYVWTGDYSEGFPVGMFASQNELTGTNSFGNFKKYHPGFGDHNQVYTP